MNVKNIFAHTNRGVLLDVVVFVLNLILMSLLAKYFIELVRLASADDALAKLALGLFFLGIFVLPAAGAVLKRWHFHHRRSSQQKRQGMAKEQTDNPGAEAWGCLLNPIFYFVLSLVISAAAGTFLGEQIFGKDFDNNGAIFIPFIFGLFVLSVIQTVLVYRYFSPPKKAPAGAFWRDQRSALLGDLCIFLNMILFQVLWNVITSTPFGRVTGFEDFAGRLFFLWFVSILIYFPPRIFYLAEDINRPTAWLTILLANSPVILRVLFGLNLNVTG